MKRLKCELDIDEVDENRYDDCRHYDCCLDQASALRWRSFTCKDCAEYKEKENKLEGMFLTGPDEQTFPPAVGGLSPTHAERKRWTAIMKELGIELYNRTDHLRSRG